MELLEHKVTVSSKIHNILTVGLFLRWVFTTRAAHCWQKVLFSGFCPIVSATTVGNAILGPYGSSQFKQWDAGGFSFVHWEGTLDLEAMKH